MLPADGRAVRRREREYVRLFLGRCAGVPDYMLSPSRGDFSGVGDIHFYYSTDEVLYGALPEFERACARAHVPHTVTARQGMVHCYCMLPYYKEAKEDFAKIVEILKKEETIR